MLGKLLSLASIGEALIGINITKKFATQFMIVVALTLIASVFASALLVFSLFEIDQALIRHGMDPDLSSLLTFLVGIFVLAIIGAVIADKLKILRAIPLAVSRAETLTDHALAVAKGLYKGFTEK